MISFVCLFVAFVVVGRSFQRRLPLSDRQRLARRLGGGALVVVGVLAAPTGLILSKTVARALLPLGLLWLLLLAWTALRLIVDDGKGGAQRRAVAPALLALALTVLGSEPLGQLVTQSLERPYRDDPFAAGSFDAVVVLGGGASEAPHGHYELGPSGDRVFLGARLWHAKQTPLLVTTGTPIEGFQRPFDSLQATTTMWVEVGVDAAAIVPVTGTRTTSEEAKQVAALAKQRGWKRVGLVTSAWHLRRSMGLFARALAAADAKDVVVVPLAADHRGTPSWEGLYSLVPVGHGAWLQQKAAWEYLGAAVGR